MTEQAKQIIEFIKNEVVRNPQLELAEDTPLVSSGLIDSLALVEILVCVERATRMRIPASKVRAKDMDTVALMLATAARVGKPRN